MRVEPVIRTLLLSSTLFIALTMVMVLGGCATPSKPTPEQVREKTAQATADFKSNAKAVAQGIREGWTRDHPLNVNSATKDQLAALPGINDATADRIIARRPYQRPDDMVTKGAVTKAQFDRFADRIKVK